MNFSLNTNWRYLLYLLLLLPVFIFRDYTPANELKYLSIVEEALRNHTWFTFYNHGEIYADKPPLFFWFVMLSKLITGGYHLWIIGLFTLLPAIGVLAVMDRWLSMEKIGHEPAVANLLLLTTAMFTGAALIVRMDMLMTFFIVLSLYTFFRIYRGGEGAKSAKWLLPVYIFLAVFSKGAMGFLIPVVSIVAFLAVKKQLRTFGRYLGWMQWGILLGLCVAWFLMVYVEGGNDYLNNILFKQTVGRGVNSYHHKEPVWFYFPNMLWSFAPWIMLYVVLIWQGIRKRMVTSDTEKFFLTTIGINIIMLSLISSKIDIYMLPIYPFVVYLASSLLYKNGQTIWAKLAVAIPVVAITLAFPAFFFVRGLIPYELKGMLPYIGLFVLSVGGVLACYMLWKNRISNAVTVVGFSALLSVCILAFILPQFNRYLGFGEMATSAQETAKKDGVENYAYYKFYTGPNMDVYLGQPLEYIDSMAQLDSLNQAPRKSILFVRKLETKRDESLANWIGKRNALWVTPKYSWYIVGGEN